jgi:signal transduction histidine kinase
MENQEHFRISSALKDLIGRELITDEYIAVFELVKNAFDAYASKVEIIFKNIYAENNSGKIIIKDNGKGMDYNDLKNKWLFVAYSAKTEGTEDYDEESKEDYRNKIKSSRIFAGAKGIGRFSCDRLGSKLNFITLKDEKDAKIENLIVDWEKFEEDQKEEFIDISVIHRNLENTEYKGFNKGTILEISALRGIWNREKLLKLKHSLEKLINPNQENDVRNFNIELIVQEEYLLDKSEQLERDRVNGPIKNFLFETLDLKTTQIITEIVSNGDFINTLLIDRGKTIYEIKEKNPYTLKSNIKIHLFQLNRAAKLNFKLIMGIEPVKYGSIFLYKNGFRIYPFGEVGEDILRIDRRKQQGYNRFLGTRDLLGRIEINDKENIDNLKETTSRDGGLIKNSNYENLEEFFIEKALKRLERYVVDLIKWGDPIPNTNINVMPEDIKKEIILLISNIAKEEDVLDLYYDKNFLDVIIEREEEENVQRNLKNVEILAEKTNNPELQKKVNKVLKQFKEHNEAFKEAQRESRVNEVLLKDKSQELSQRKEQIKFFQSIISRDYDQAINFLHLIGTLALSVENNIESFTRKFRDYKNIPMEDVFPFLQKISFSVEKVLSYSGYVTKANYKMEEVFVDGDIIEFIIQYLNDYKDILIGERNISVHINNFAGKPFIKKFQPINIKIIIDNLFSNSKKVKPKNIDVTFEIENNELIIKFKDDGPGLSKEIKNPEHIFDMGFTTTKGSGLGLYNVKETLKDEKGSISVNQSIEKGFELILRIKK